jgi:hypothetical protein
MANLDLFFGDVLEQLDDIVSDAKKIVEKRTKWQANVGWEIADGEFMWDMGKVFDNRIDAQQWVDSLIKTGNFDAGQVEKKLVS